MGPLRHIVVTASLAVGCSFSQAPGDDSGIMLADTGDGDGDGGVGSGDGDGATNDDGVDESEGGDDGGCGSDADCPVGHSCVGGLCVGEMCPDGEPCDSGEVCRQGAIDCSSGQAECITVGNAPAGQVCGAGFVCDINGNCVECVDGAQCQPQAECSVGMIDCGDGDPICNPSDWHAEGTPCSEGRYCNDSGVCLTALDCATIQVYDPTVVSGIYPIDPDGAGGETPITAFCDFDTGGGAWSLWRSADVDTLASNASMPRCGGSVSGDCFAGTFVGRGDAPGVYRITTIAEELQDDLGWSAVTAEQEHLAPCAELGMTCMGGADRCLFSFIAPGDDCCSTENMNNLCLQ